MAGLLRSGAGWWRPSKRGRRTPIFSAQTSSSDRKLYGDLPWPGMSDSSNSSTIFCECTARSELARTSMFVLGWRQQDGASTRSPLISTMQARQLPSGR